MKNKTLITLLVTSRFKKILKRMSIMWIKLKKMYHVSGSYIVKNMKDWRNEKTTTDPVKLLTPLTSYWSYNVGHLQLHSFIKCQYWSSTDIELRKNQWKYFVSLCIYRNYKRVLPISLFSNCGLIDLYH